MTAAPEDEYLTLREAAAELSVLHIDRRTLARYVERLPGAKRATPRRWVIPRSTVEAIREKGLGGVTE